MSKSNFNTKANRSLQKEKKYFLYLIPQNTNINISWKRKVVMCFLFLLTCPIHGSFPSDSLSFLKKNKTAFLFHRRLTKEHILNIDMKTSSPKFNAFKV